MKFLQSLERKFRSVRNNYRRKVQNKILKDRWAAKPTKQPVVENFDVTGLDRCVIHFINLKHRKDRKIEILAELTRLGISDFTRFDAVADQNGALGCARSHAQLLEGAQISKDQLFMICEDDCQFVMDRIAIDVLIEEFFFNPHLDVLCLAYNATNSFQISQTLMITSDTQTTSCYIVKPQAIGMVLGCALKSVCHLSLGEPGYDFAIDQVWKELQSEIYFALPKDPYAVQRPSFSDIENSYQNYGL